MSAPMPVSPKPVAGARANTAGRAGQAAAPSPALLDAAKAAGSYQAGRAVVSPDSPAAQVKVGPPIAGASKAARQYRDQEAQTVARTALGGRLADRRSSFERRVRDQLCGAGSKIAATPKGGFLPLELAYGSAGQVAGASLPADLQSYLGVSPQSQLSLMSQLASQPVTFEVLSSTDSAGGKVVVLSAQGAIEHTLAGPSRSVVLRDVVKLNCTVVCGRGSQAGLIGAAQAMVADPKASAVAAVHAGYRATDLDGVGAAP